MVKVHDAATTFATMMGIRRSTNNSLDLPLLVEMTGRTPVYCNIFAICSVVNGWDYFSTLFHVNRRQRYQNSRIRYK